MDAPRPKRSGPEQIVVLRRCARWARGEAGDPQTMLTDAIAFLEVVEQSRIAQDATVGFKYGVMIMRLWKAIGQTDPQPAEPEQLIHAIRGMARTVRKGQCDVDTGVRSIEEIIRLGHPDVADLISANRETVKAAIVEAVNEPGDGASIDRVSKKLGRALAALGLGPRKPSLPRRRPRR